MSVSVCYQIGSSDELDKIVLTDSKDKLVVVDYSTTWCGPCKLVLPKFEALSEEYKDAIFLKVRTPYIIIYNNQPFTAGPPGGICCPCCV